MAKKKSTADILAQLRSQDSSEKDAGPEADETAETEQAETKPAEAEPAETKPTEKPAEKPPAPSAGGKPPKSTKDILAKLRGEAAGGQKPAQQQQPSAEKTPSKQAATEKPAKETAAAVAAAEGEKPSLQEMLKAVRETEKPPQPAPEQGEEKKPARRKPAALRKPVSKATADRGRRSALAAILAAPLVLFGSPFATAWTCFTAATAAFTLALARFMMPNILVEPPSRFKVGSPNDYPGGTVSTKWKSEFGVWIVHNVYQGRDVIYALISVCTHLGCTPNWLEGEQKFKCPCHGSGFYITGINFEGPAPRPLERAAIQVAPDGMLEVDKSQKFQQEMGQWDDPASYVEVA